ncbi:NFACT family protein [Campylobacter canadensis]|uniref:DUF814 domain-containing protein n=1 Tax=Campylobacter canadensis TaxID=449520 RepID=A0ABS7WRF0_9BACT|nr:NFACT family protein [Campylobacter canadensis]MBZ7986529.1 DUF814 domain-containing protein [Campylobacter canadensis]MBZ7994066.1 DUF814 domain-containing protein [Campylobacter canadensis]MBZ7995931.1 DUF814 domain-containing protein [Campylobacter canadensis]MBZ7997565.1 DUF814 domain-containing protein [Campylobacter canadensis]MBZ7999397.1 DUF814 domain-containing protein [Campylobacter canadensis]
MNYYDLVQIADYLKKYKKIYKAYRVSDNSICIHFDERLCFDLSKFKSAIYKADFFAKNYNSPFDLMLKKYLFNAKILDINVLKNNRILYFHCELAHAYKKQEFYFVLEFSGRFTNALFLDENKIIISALRYYENARIIKQNEKYIDLKETKISEKYIEIINFEEYFKNKYEEIFSNKLNDIKKQKNANIDKKIQKIQYLLDNLEDEKKLEEKALFEYKKGEILKANLYKIKEYERNFSLENINFNLKNSASIEINSIFKNAKKLKQKAKNINIEKENLQNKIKEFEYTKTAINLAKDEYFLQSFKQKKNDKKINENILNFYLNEYKISVGLNENANIWLLKNSKKDDMWFHLKDLKGAHVIISSNKQKYDIDLIYHAASLCACYSGKKNGNFLVDFTQRKNVKIIEKAYVNYVNYDTIKVFL